MKINKKQHITRRGVVKRNPPSANKTISLKLKNDRVFPSPEWRTIAHEKDEGKIHDDFIYFYAPNSLNFSKIKIGDTIELDEDFVVVGIEGRANNMIGDIPQIKKAQRGRIKELQNQIQNQTSNETWTVLTNTTPGHNKFWSYKINGNVAEVRWGKIGTNGESGTFDREVVIRRENEKRNKGYEYYNEHSSTPYPR